MYCQRYTTVQSLHSKLKFSRAIFNQTHPPYKLCTQAIRLSVAARAGDRRHRQAYGVHSRLSKTAVGLGTAIPFARLEFIRHFPCLCNGRVVAL